jgi:sodium transport system permease protein
VEAEPGAAKALEAGQQAKVTLLYTKRSDRSIEARDRLRKALEAKGAKVLEQRLVASNLPPTFARPVELEERDVDFQQNVGPLIASRMLPSLLVMMLFMGAFYAALDVTAGEKERGTLETLLVAPVRPFEVMLSKYLAVALVAVVTALVNLAAMGVTFGFGIKLDQGLQASVSLTAGQVMMLLFGLVPAACLVSALSLAVASLARTHKEGQSLLTPLLMVGILPGVAAQMPGIELSTGTALVPLLNVALLVRAVVLGPVPWTHVGLTLVSVGLCCVGAIWMAANAFKSEKLRFGGTEGWRDLFRLR